MAKLGTTPNRYMPELPEVETVKRLLEKIVTNRTITDIKVLRKNNVKNDPDIFVNSLKGETFLSMSRIGKFLIFHLSHDKVIVSHLRMEGKYYELDKDEPNTKYSRVVICLDNNKKLCYDDSRCFGYLKLSSEKEYKLDKEIKKIGPEPWDADVSTVIKQAKNKSIPIKTAILSQEIITGLGNIYVDETLFASKIHPLTPANKISKKEWETILKESSRILKEAIESGGSTIKSYHPGKDIDGNFQTRLLVYGKNGSNCPICHHPYRFIKVNGRGTTFCPNCQILKNKQLKVAIFGPISSGKSTVLQCFKENNIPTISADEVVNYLYQRKDVIDKINKTFDLEGNIVDRNILRNKLSKDPKLIKKIDKIVWPLVKEEISIFIKKHPKGIVVAEVPLLFEAKMENMFDVLIGVESNKNEKLLENRDGNKAQELKIINSISTYQKNKEKADFIINNDSDLNSLNNKTNKIINKLIDRLD